MSFLTLLTDFGIKDGNVGVMKGVIWGIAPHVQIADLSHTVNPQNIQEAALVLFRSAPYFPPGTVHVVVVDPGVGTARRPIAARLGHQRFVGPDNGVLTLLLEKVQREKQPVEIYHLDRQSFWRADVSHVFHGRDIFAPIGAHLANGMPLSSVGTQIKDPILIPWPQPQPTDNGWKAEVVHIDHFGNISSNLMMEHLQSTRPLKVRLGGAEINGLVRTFGERPAGELVALFGSTGSLIVSVVNGSAADRLGVRVGDPLEVEWM